MTLINGDKEKQKHFIYYHVFGKSKSFTYLAITSILHWMHFVHTKKNTQIFDGMIDLKFYNIFYRIINKINACAM